MKRRSYIIPNVAPRASVVPSPAGRAATEDKGQRSMRTTSEAELSDIDPAGRASVHQVESTPPRRSASSDAPPRTGKSSRIDVRLSPHHRAAVDRRASDLGIKPSAWVRGVVLDALEGRGRHTALQELAAASTPDPTLARAVDQVRRVGINLNQSLRRGLVADTEQIRGVLDAVNEVRTALGDRTAL